MPKHGWTLLFHTCLIEQLQKLNAATDRACAADPENFESNANVKLFRALSQLILETIPNNPAREEYRQGTTLGPDYRHWRRTKIGQRFRLFFRYDSKARLIIYAWVNDEHTLRNTGCKTDPYAVFQRMLKRGNPPNDWLALLAACREDYFDKSGGGQGQV
jgi:toxin YhaV